MFRQRDTLRFTSRFRIGKPHDTGAVIVPIEEGGKKAKAIPGFEIDRSKNGLVLRRKLGDGDAVYGLGEVLGSLDRRGKRFRLFAKDDPLHTPDKPGLYGSHPFFFVQASESFGAFIDCPSEITFDVCFARRDLLQIEIHSRNFDFYLFKYSDLREVIREFLTLVGKPVIPPRWAFGYQQCRYSYPDQETVSNIAANLRHHRLPSDAIYIDIDYMKDYKIFSVDEERFPDLPGLVRTLKQQGFHLIPIIDPAVRIENGFEPYESGLADDVFCKDKKNAPFSGAVWPGLSHLPDFFRRRTREWWSRCHKKFIDWGIDAFWNDMNEPAIFYTPDGLRRLKKAVRAIPSTLDLGVKPIETLFNVTSFWASESYYDRFFHELDDGQRIPHRTVHNIYGASMARATAQALDSAAPDKRHFVLTRSSYIGSHRDAVLWTGDNHSWWEHMLSHMRMIQSLNMIGFFFCGADVGGFSADTSPQLLVRWIQLGIFTPLFRNHSSKETRQQEPWEFDEETLRAIRHALEIRSALLPYLYSEYLKSVEENRPLVTPLFLNFDGKVSRQIEDQFFVGDSIMAAPVHQQNASGRFIFLPEGLKWLFLKFKEWDRYEWQVKPAGTFFAEIELDEVAILLPENKFLPLRPPKQNDAETEPEELTVVGLVCGHSELVLRGDDGESKQSEHWTLRVRIAGGACSSAEVRGSGCPYRAVRLVLVDELGQRAEQRVECFSATN